MKTYKEFINESKMSDEDYDIWMELGKVMGRNGYLTGSLGGLKWRVNSKIISQLIDDVTESESMKSNFTTDTIKEVWDKLNHVKSINKKLIDFHIELKGMVNDQEFTDLVDKTLIEIDQNPNYRDTTYDFDV